MQVFGIYQHFVIIILPVYQNIQSYKSTIHTHIDFVHAAYELKSLPTWKCAR